MVGLLQARRRTAQYLPTGRLDTPPHSQVLLAALARCPRAAARSATVRFKRTDAQSGPQFPRRLASGRHREFADCPEQRGPETLWFRDAIRLGGVRPAAFNRRMRENRTSGG